MTRVTLGQLKEAMRNPRARFDPAAQREGFPTPYPIATRAVRLYHDEGPTSAHTYLNRTLDRSTYWGALGPARAQSWADAIRECFDSYIRMADGDERPTIGARVRADVEAGTHEVGVHIDVVLLDPGGYVGRYVLWEREMLDTRDSQLIAAPIVAALGSELGRDRVAGVELWHLRSETGTFVEAPVAIDTLREVTRIVDAYIVD